jgi:NitT/TauT family transport system ATP-binding protein
VTPPCLEVRGISKRFASRKSAEIVHALDKVSFNVEAGEYVSLLGRSGCGKSTFLAVLSGLEKPDAGEVLMDGEAITGPARRRMLMFQESALFPWLNVFDNVLYGLKQVESMSRAERLERASEYLELVGLTRFKRFRVHELSGGMRQRTALARALAPDPEVLLMDEPFSALDAMTREQLYADMQRIWEKTRKTVIMVTHNAREACCLSSRVILMETPGRIVGDERITLAYPRDMNDVSVTRMAAAISKLLQNTQAAGVS